MEPPEGQAPALHKNIRLGWGDGDKHSSLSRNRIINGRRKISMTNWPRKESKWGP